MTAREDMDELREAWAGLKLAVWSVLEPPLRALVRALAGMFE